MRAQATTELKAAGAASGTFMHNPPRGQAKSKGNKTTKFEPYQHTAELLSANDGNSYWVREAWDSHARERPLSLGLIGTGEYHKISLSSLLSKEAAIALQDIVPQDFTGSVIDYLEQKYQTLELITAYQVQPKISSEHQIQVGAANLSLFELKFLASLGAGTIQKIFATRGKRLKKIAAKWNRVEVTFVGDSNPIKLYSAHGAKLPLARTAEKLDRIAQEYFGKQKQMSCSGYGAYTKLIALHLLNQMVVKELNKNGHANINSALRIPLANENPDYLSPSRLIKALQKENAIDTLPPPPIITAAVSLPRPLLAPKVVSHNNWATLKGRGSVGWTKRSDKSKIQQMNLLSLQATSIHQIANSVDNTSGASIEDLLAAEDSGAGFSHTFHLQNWESRLTALSDSAWEKFSHFAFHKKVSREEFQRLTLDEQKELTATFLAHSRQEKLDAELFFFYKTHFSNEAKLLLNNQVAFREALASKGASPHLIDLFWRQRIHFFNHDEVHLLFPQYQSYNLPFLSDLEIEGALTKIAKGVDKRDPHTPYLPTFVSSYQNELQEKVGARVDLETATEETLGAFLARARELYSQHDNLKAVIHALKQEGYRYRQAKMALDPPILLLPEPAIKTLLGDVAPSAFIGLTTKKRMEIISSYFLRLAEQPTITEYHQVIFDNFRLECLTDCTLVDPLMKPFFEKESALCKEGAFQAAQFSQLNRNLKKAILHRSIRARPNPIPLSAWVNMDLLNYPYKTRGFQERLLLLEPEQVIAIVQSYQKLTAKELPHPFSLENLKEQLAPKTFSELPYKQRLALTEWIKKAIPSYLFYEPKSTHTTALDQDSSP